MSYERILAVSRELEHLLGEAGATGQGPQTKINSIEEQLDPAIVKRMRFVAAIRNSAFHDKDFSYNEDLLSRYEQAGRACIQYMEEHLASRQTQGQARPSQSANERENTQATSDDKTIPQRVLRFGLASAALAILAWWGS